MIGHTGTGRVRAIQITRNEGDGRPTTLPGWTARLMLLMAFLVLAGCGKQASSVVTSTPANLNLPPIPTPTEFPMGSGQPAPLRDSLALIRPSGRENVAGAALIIASDGFLVTVNSNLGKKAEIVLPDGRVAVPIRVASDSTTGLTLLKVAADHLVPIQLGLEPVSARDQIFAAGFDETTSRYGQVAGQVVSAGAPTPAGTPSIFTTNIGFAQGLSGGALSDKSGQIIGLVISGQDGASKNVVAAIPMRYVTDWIAGWRRVDQNITIQSANWASISTVRDLRLRYPSGWSVANESRNGSSFFADIAPNDPDVPVKLSISIQPSDFQGDPINFAHQQFDKKSNATIWGEVEFGLIRGVRTLVNQEGARVDVVYLFARGLRIGLSLSAGYSVNDTGAQEQMVTALFEAVLRSITFAPTTPSS